MKLAIEFRRRLIEELGQPVKVIMYGSQARGDARSNSDIDLLVVLPTVNSNIRGLVSDIAWELGFETGRFISTTPTTKEKMKRYAFLPFYQNVKREGVRV